MRKPMIGLVPLYDECKDSYWMLPGYMTGLTQAGAVPVMLPLTASEEDVVQLADALDGFLLTGGHDVDPELYGEEKRQVCGTLCMERDRLEVMLLEQVLKRNKPVFGICRGLQLLNVYLGGTLYQDLQTERPGSVEHRMKPPYDAVAHEVELAEDGLLMRITGQKRLGVNSCHHQGVKELAPELTVEAIAEDGLVEAVSMKGRGFAAAVQWHPEFSWQTDENSRKILGAFVEACRKGR